MSEYKDLDELILRTTSYPPLTNKGTKLTWSEMDANFTKLYQAIQGIVNGANVPAYDAGREYDFYATDPLYKYASYGSRIWKAVWAGSPSGFTGQVPDEAGGYWEQVSLAQMLGNPVALTKIAEAFDDNREASAIYSTPWEAHTALDIFTNPIDLDNFAAEADYYYSPLYMDFALEAGAVAFDFGGGGIYIDFSSSLGNKMIPIQQAKINSASDLIVRIGIAANTLMTVNDKLQLTAAANATVGNGTYYTKIYYQKTAKPF